MMTFPRPRLLISACLEYQEVRYDGKSVPCGIIRQLEPYVDYILVCPEYQIGLGAPREALRLVMVNGEHRMIQPRSGRDVTDEISAFTKHFLDTLPVVDGFIFRSRSPTHGLKGVKVYKDPVGPLVADRASGLFSREVLRRYHGYPIEEDMRLNNPEIRYNFLAKLFMFAGLREALESGLTNSLEQFHEKNRLLLMAHDPGLCRRLDGVLVQKDGQAYFEAFRGLCSTEPDTQSYALVMESLQARCQGYLAAFERQWFKNALEKYRSGELCLEGMVEIARLLALKHGGSLEVQTIFEPFPPGLMLGTAEVRTRKYYQGITR